MGIIEKGMFGAFRKKTGNLVGARWRKVDVIRSVPRKSTKPPTQAQIDQHLRFALIISFFSRISNLIDAYFGKGDSTPTQMNLAVSYRLKEAVTGVAPDFTIDYTRIRFSMGNLSLPDNMAADAVTAGKVDFTWDDDGLDDKRKDATDMVNVLIYNPTKDKFVIRMKAAPRSAKTYSLQLPPNFSGDSVHTFISFTSVMKKQLHSRSEYLGLLPVL